MRHFRIAFALLVAAVVCAPRPVFAEPARERAREQEDSKLWVSLGSRTVDFKNAKDVFEVGRKEGRFTQLRFKVDSGEVFMGEISVTFGDGTTTTHKMDHEFKEGSRSHEIEIGEGKRIIKKVEFSYHKLKHSEPVTIELLGKEAK